MATKKTGARKPLSMLERVSVLFFQNYFGVSHLTIAKVEGMWRGYKESGFHRRIPVTEPVDTPEGVWERVEALEAKTIEKTPPSKRAARRQRSSNDTTF